MYPRGESNPNRWNWNPIFYPLNYGDIFTLTKIATFIFPNKYFYPVVSALTGKLF